MAWMVVAAAPGQESDFTRARRAHAISRELMSPYCPGRTLADCPSPSAAVLRDEIRGLVDQGESNSAILSQLRSRFGDVIVGVPRSAVGWIVPSLILVLGAVFLALMLRRLAGHDAAPNASDPSCESEEDLDRRIGL